MTPYGQGRNKDRSENETGTTPNEPAEAWESPFEAAIAKINKKHAALLSAAAASGNAEVHNLLGHRLVAEQNEDIEALKEIDKELGDLVK